MGEFSILNLQLYGCFKIIISKFREVRVQEGFKVIYCRKKQNSFYGQIGVKLVKKGVGKVWGRLRQKNYGMKGVCEERWLKLDEYLEVVWNFSVVEIF